MASLKETTTISWNEAIILFQVAIDPWRQRQITTQQSRRDVLEVFLFSKLYYLAQALPMPAVTALAITAAASVFLWGDAGFGDKWVAWETLHCPLTSSGLAITHLPSRAEALLVKQACWMAAQENQLAAHLAYWHGSALSHLCPQLQPPQDLS